MRAAAEDEKYMGLITHYISQKYTLRYSGGLVPDVVHALVKGHGVYISPVTDKSKAKLRKLFELAPIALLVECAGGAAVDPVTGERILGKAIDNINDRGGLICGTSEEVEFAVQKLASH
jgi:sedoheptulose-bisphosphatase